MTLIGKQFTVSHEMLNLLQVIGIGLELSLESQASMFFKICFCFVFLNITNHLMTGPLGNSEFCFPRISMFPKTNEILRKQIHCSPWDQSLSVKHKEYHNSILTLDEDVHRCIETLNYVTPYKSIIPFFFNP